MKFNMNNTVSVVLTDSGAKVWNARWSDTKLLYRYLPRYFQAGDTLTEQFWVIMQVFGPHIHMGMQPLFEGMDIEFDIKHFREG